MPEQKLYLVQLSSGIAAQVHKVACLQEKPGTAAPVWKPLRTATNPLASLFEEIRDQAALAERLDPAARQPQREQEPEHSRRDRRRDSELQRDVQAPTSLHTGRRRAEAALDQGSGPCRWRSALREGIGDCRFLR